MNHHVPCSGVPPDDLLGRYKALATSGCPNGSVNIDQPSARTKSSATFCDKIHLQYTCEMPAPVCSQTVSH